MAAWKPGESGNPDGRKPGSKNRRTEMIEGLRLAGVTSAEFCERLVEKAMEGDSTALRLATERLVPMFKATMPTIEIEFSGRSVSERIEAIADAMAEGRVPPDAADHMTQVVLGIRDAQVVEDLEARISELEARK